MKIDPRLTLRQQRVLRAYRDGDKTLEQICKTFKLKTWLLSKWLEQRLFRAALTKVHATLDRQAALEIDRAVSRATQVVAAALTGKPPKAQKLKAALEVLKLHFGRLRSHKSPKSPQPPYPIPIHPNISLDEARELMAQLNGHSHKR